MALTSGTKLGPYEIREGGFVVLKHGFEMVEFGVGGNQRGEIVGVVHPQSFHSPNETFDGVALNFNAATVDVDGVRTAILDPDGARRQHGEFGWGSVGAPVAHQLHLNG